MMDNEVFAGFLLMNAKLYLSNTSLMEQEVQETVAQCGVRLASILKRCEAYSLSSTRATACRHLAYLIEQMSGRASDEGLMPEYTTEQYLPPGSPDTVAVFDEISRDCDSLFADSTYAESDESGGQTRDSTVPESSNLPQSIPASTTANRVASISFGLNSPTADGKGMNLQPVVLPPSHEMICGPAARKKAPVMARRTLRRPETFVFNKGLYLPHPDKVYSTLFLKIGNLVDHGSVKALTNLFYAIASPDAFSQLAEVMRYARENDYLDDQKADYSHDPAGWMHSLDRIETSAGVSHLLRRYYLVKLLDRRIALEMQHQSDRRKRPRRQRLLRYDIERIGQLHSMPSAHQNASLIPAQQRKRKKRADSAAICDMVSDMCPGIVASHDSTDAKEAAKVSRLHQKLRTRLFCARNWYLIQQEFSSQLLAFIPCGGEYEISLDQIEKLGKEPFLLFLQYLRSMRGEFLDRIGEVMPTDFFDKITNARHSAPFKFELSGHIDNSAASYDSDYLKNLCSISAG